MTVAVDGACPGDGRVRVLAATSVTYCYTVTNIGRMPAHDIVITDERGKRVCTSRITCALVPGTLG